jgi:hypothetical protein
MQSIVQIFKVNEARTGLKDGRAWAMQDAECALLDDTGNVVSVGVLMLPKEMQSANAPKPGVYLGMFSLAAGMRDRRIEARLTGLNPVSTKRAAS